MLSIAHDGKCCQRRVRTCLFRECHRQRCSQEAQMVQTENTCAVPEQEKVREGCAEVDTASIAAALLSLACLLFCDKPKLQQVYTKPN